MFFDWAQWVWLPAKLGAANPRTPVAPWKSCHPPNTDRFILPHPPAPSWNFTDNFVDVLDIHLSSNSKAIMVKRIKNEVVNLVREKKLKIVLMSMKPP